VRHVEGAELQVDLDLRYVGQEFTLQVPVTLAQLKKGNRRAIRTRFDKLYEHRYAHHSPDEAVEMVNIRLAVVGKRPRLKFPSLKAAARAKRERARKVSKKVTEVLADLILMAPSDEQSTLMLIFRAVQVISSGK
jgi:N-methylhydantoinase A